jgi:hypothetical protein
MMNSLRRFAARPLTVLLGAIGLVSPKPRASSRLASIPSTEVRWARTESARS